ncbi:uncharacterized protein LOC105698523 [Orussus abietinus]|uniref:uncharacterized protein LOC105698523 n=1 Tax=Orussus abietinus TaxID=222816 RepID=UPI0006256FD4|nr:uncharacterized protein LOC105698523 [Orussus abietinus]
MASKCSLVLTVILCVSYRATSAPSVSFTSQAKAQEEEYSPGIFSNMASKAMGAFLKAASYIWKWLPSLPESLRPPPPTFRFVDSKSDCVRDIEVSLEDFQ